ncbi:enoyl-CoA hydratase/isomerase family protein [Pseudemcibacter aquimaris]|uniref:enoyl-CoA hydratase/isomerase family protein n=1 Tax=Pseudemcibacter aquimaris TaxID=2857064 RepID=UPI0020130246|nr:enoyl-CoA hydratase-related protein [Pseudemcibacter aquimaris]MCC3860353.1 enoyl-CoA hydratase/isomerase family protein [Pseudemcibacter aquimaris]WDU57679.1 enoyl-CoA hydratase/isomerase family protein [Pseudemcibacter aquimaris]
MSEQAVKIAISDDNPGIAIVSFNRPDQFNSITIDVLDGMIQAAEQIAADQNIRAVILTGEGQFFSSGADFSLFAGAMAEKDTTKSRFLGGKGAKMCDVWEALPQPTICAIEGGVVGGGLALAMACDWRIMGASSYAYVPEVKMGVNFGWGSLPRLTGLVGAPKAKYMSILCEKHGVDECLEWGLADFKSDDGGALSKAMELAGKIAEFPALPVQLIKRGVNIRAGAIAKVSGYADTEDLLLCMKDEEAGLYRMETIKKLQGK